MPSAFSHGLMKFHAICDFIQLFMDNKMSALLICESYHLNIQDPNSGDDFNKDTIERDERRLTELGRRTVEIYVLTHIFRYVTCF